MPTVLCSDGDLFARSFGDRNCPARIKWLKTRRKRDAAAAAASARTRFGVSKSGETFRVAGVCLPRSLASSDTVPWHISRETTLKTNLAVIQLYYAFVFG